MKKLLTSLQFCIVIAWCSEAQITVLSNTFPQIGDTLNFAIQINPSIQMTEPGGPYNWNYSGLQAQIEQDVVLKPANAGSINVPAATMVADYPGGIENYYSSSTSSFLLVAVKGPVEQLFGINNVLHYNPPREERRAPLNYLDVYSSTSNLLIPFSTESIPSAVIDSLGLPFVPDSIRLRIASKLSNEVDAYGTIQLPNGIFDALRVKRIEAIETRFDVLLPFFGWQDVTDVVLSSGQIPGIGNDTIVSYLFFSNTEKEVLLEATMDSTGQDVQQAVFFNGEVLSFDNSLISGLEPLVQFYPNPFSTYLTVKSGYSFTLPIKIEIFDAEGQQIVRFWISSSDELVLVDYNFPVQRGIYFYKAVDGNGNFIQEGKLIKW